ncbi:MAG: hypothetical protein K2G07_03725 [Muribaculaceae bacterium]|nr:hypothetical protein [Muribaculaceae bacterium]
MKLKPEFVASLAELGHAYADLPAALEGEPEVSVRVNAAKGARPVDGLEPVAWCPGGFYLPGRPAFTFDPALHQGLYYVQDASSMALAAVAAQVAAAEGGRPLRWLDACAAPGGKTTAIASELPPGSVLVANEYDQRRYGSLVENTAKWGDPRVACVRGDAVRFGRMEGAFDVVSADVPCSGEGMMRKDAEAAAQWSPALVADCARTQWRIVEALWNALRPGGTFIYSTCTFNRSENEEIVARMVAEFGATGMEVAALERPEVVRGIDSPVPCYRFVPGRLRGEGLFLCLLRKPGDAPAAALRTPRYEKPDARVAAAVASWLDGDYRLRTAPDGSVYALRREAAALVPDAQGLHVATVKGRDLIPAQPVALSTALRPGAFPTAEVDYPTALAYLRREAVALDHAPRGIVLLHYAGRPLGFVKNLGSRANNLYPQPWRIMSTHAPATPPQVVATIEL